MTNLAHDTLRDLHRGTPGLVLWSARILPAVIGAQFLLAGLALFGGASWDLHGAVGGLAAVPILVLAFGSLTVARLRGFAWWASLTSFLYFVQVALTFGGPGLLAFHPFNAALLLTSALVLAAKFERRRGYHREPATVQDAHRRPAGDDAPLLLAADHAIDEFSTGLRSGK